PVAGLVRIGVEGAAVGAQSLGQKFAGPLLQFRAAYLQDRPDGPAARAAAVVLVDDLEDRHLDRIDLDFELGETIGKVRVLEQRMPAYALSGRNTLDAQQIALQDRHAST